MAVTNPLIAHGTVPTSKGDILAATATGTYSIDLYQSSATPQVLLIYLKRSGGSSSQQARLTLNQYDTVEIIVALASGDTVEMQTTTVSVVNYTTGGYQK